MKLRYTLPALADLNSILDYIAARSPQGARRVQGRIQGIIGLLLAHPDIGIHTDDPVIRRLSTPPYPYLVFYEVTESEIIIHAVPRSFRDAGLCLGDDGPWHLAIIAYPSSISSVTS